MPQQQLAAFRPTAIGLVGALALALLNACVASTPAPQQGLAATMTPVIPAEVPTELPTLAATLEIPTDMPTALPTLTATPVLPAEVPTETSAAGALTPIVDATSGFLLGGVQDGRWISAELAAPLIGDGEQYRIVRDGRIAGQQRGAAAVQSSLPCEESYNVPLPGLPNEESTSAETLAVGGDWELFPQLPQDLSVDQPVYQQAVAVELRARGIAEPDVQIQRIVRVDLEGDGIDEVIVSATHYQDRFEGGSLTPSAASGDYSLILLRRLVGGEVVTLPVAQEVYTQAAEFSAPSEHLLTSVLDLNGDGTLEIVVRSRYYEGAFLGVYELVDDQAQLAIGAGCGV